MLYILRGLPDSRRRIASRAGQQVRYDCSHSHRIASSAGAIRPVGRSGRWEDLCNRFHIGREQVEAVGAALLVLLIYVAALASLPRHVFLSPDEGGKFLMMRSLQLDADAAVPIAYGAAAIDPELRYYPSVHGRTPTFPYPLLQDGEVRFHWSVAFPAASLIAYEWFGLPGVYLLPMLCGWALAIGSGLVAARLLPGTAGLTTIVVGLGSPVFFYSTSFWEHTVASALAVLAVHQAMEGGWRRLAFALVALSAAAILRAETLVVAISLPVTLAFDQRQVLLARLRDWSTVPLGRRITAVTAVLLGAGLVAYLLYPMLPEPVRLAIQWLPMRLSYVARRIDVLPTGLVGILVNDSGEEGPLQAGWIEFAALLGVAIALVAALPFARRWCAGLVAVGVSLLLACSLSILTSSDPYRSLHGFFPVAPLMLAAPLCFCEFGPSGSARARTLARLSLLSLVIGWWVLFATFVVPNRRFVTGLEWGQRYLLTFYPLLLVLGVVGAGASWRHRRDTLSGVTLAGLCVTAAVVGICFQVRGWHMRSEQLGVMAEWDRRLAESDAVATDAGWLASALAPQFADRPFFYMQDWNGIDDWLALAEASELCDVVLVGGVPPPPVRPGDRTSQVEELAGLYVLPVRLCQESPARIRGDGTSRLGN